MAQLWVHAMDLMLGNCSATARLMLQVTKQVYSTAPLIKEP